MSKIIDYKVSLENNGHGILMVQYNIGEDFQELCDLGYVHGKPAQEVNELADYALQEHDLSVATELVSVWEDSMKDQKDDLSFVRTKMRAVLRELSNKEISMTEKKEKLGIYQTMCAASQMIINSAKLELALQTINTAKKQIK